MTNDVEKRWHALGDRSQLGWAIATPGVLFCGALGAFVKTYRDWRARRTWPIWQGAGWFLLTLSLLALGVPAMGVLGTTSTGTEGPRPPPSTQAPLLTSTWSLR